MYCTEYSGVSGTFNSTSSFIASRLPSGRLCGLPSLSPANPGQTFQGTDLHLPPPILRSVALCRLQAPARAWQFHPPITTTSTSPSSALCIYSDFTPPPFRPVVICSLHMHAGSLVRRRLLLSSANNPLYQSASSQSIHPTRARILPPLCQSAGTLTLSYPLRRQPFSTSPLSSFKEPRKASSFWPITFTLLLIGGGTWLQDKYRKSGNDPQLESLPPSPPPQDDYSVFLGVIDTLQTMPVEAAPGTVGNLTPDQEAKLREFWILLFKLFGIKIEGLEELNGDAPAPPSPTQDKKKQSKRRFTFWGKSNEEEADDSASLKSANGVSSSLASLSITDGDDKFGQTKDFQKALVDMKPEEIRTTFWNMVKQDNPDALLLRFLRARKWDVKKALIMLISTIRWRLLEVNIDDDIMRNGEHLALKQSKSSDPKEKKKGEDFLMQMRMGKSFLHGVDKHGRPICVIRVRLHRAADQSTEALDRFTVYTIESARMMLAPPVETAVSVKLGLQDFPPLT